MRAFYAKPPVPATIFTRYHLRRMVAGRLLARHAAEAYILFMHAHDHHEHSGQALSRAAETTLVKAGEQWTEMRASVFGALAGFDKPASAYDIADAVSKKEGRRVAPNSVYRILDLFVNANLARRVESSNAYVANAHPDCMHDCIFLVCDACGQTTHIDDDSITREVRSAASATGFQPVRPVIEVRGKCRNCA